MPLTDDKHAFSQRLTQALKRSAKKVSSATDLALQFNLRHKNEPITMQAAQKWLTGQARPTPDKIETLAAWLNVSAQWLRYGIAEDRPTVTAKKLPKSRGEAPAPLTKDEALFLGRIRAMPEHRRNLVIEIVEQFSLEQEMWRE